MKKIFRQTVMLLCFALMGQALMAEEIVRDGVRYAITNEPAAATATVLGFTATGGNKNLEIPMEVVENGVTYTVTSISEQAFMSQSIVSLTIPASVTLFGNRAFMNCPTLTTVTYLGTVQPQFGGSDVFSAGGTQRTLNVPNASSGFEAALWGATTVNYGETGGNDFTATTDNTSFTADGGSGTINLYSPVGWRATVTPNSGLSLNPTQGQANANAVIQMTVEPNNTTEQRTFNILFNETTATGASGAWLKTLTITQAGSSGSTESFVTTNVPNGAIHFLGNGDEINGYGMASYLVQSNTKWRVQIYPATFQSMISVDPMFGFGNAQSTLHVIAPNTDPSPLSYSIQYIGENTNQVLATINITQDVYTGGTGGNDFTATTNNTSFTADGGSGTINLYSPVGWRATVTPNSGLSLNPTTGQANANAVLQMTVEPNSTTEQRTFNILFNETTATGASGAWLKTLTITQDAPATTPDTFVEHPFLYERTGNEMRLLGFDDASYSQPEVVILEKVVFGGISYPVTSISEQAFMSQSIVSLTLPASVTLFGSRAFMNCPTLTTVTYLGTVQPQFGGSDVFSAGGTQRTLNVPNASSGFDAALWGATTVNYGDGGGTGTMHTITFFHYLADDGTPVQTYATVEHFKYLVKPADPIRPGYTFEYWSSTPDYVNGPFSFENTNIMSSFTLYAKWKQDDGTITINGIVYRIETTGGAGVRVAIVVNAGSNASANVVIPSSIIANGVSVPVTTIANRAFTSHQGLVSVTIPASVTTVNGYAFLQCHNLKSITYLGATNPIVDCSTAVNPDCVLYVPNASDGFSPQQCWGATSIVYGGNAPVVEERTETTAVVTWNLVENAVSYYLYLYTDVSKTTELAVYEFNSDGDYVGRLRAKSAAAVVPTFNLEGLSSDVEYYVEVEAVNAEEEVLLSQALVIPTLENFTGINDVVNTNDVKVIGYYNILGQKLPQAPEKGIYIIQYNNGKTEKIIKQ
ncbi:MAG: leucine-rich repeat protein [Tannerella sp.]|jgi:uncharacterized repeat protein (TIGR02543 family)|nr:leucine-rich repeat protein [Tannerella sp.]